jgi:hypothetical protein
VGGIGLLLLCCWHAPALANTAVPPLDVSANQHPCCLSAHAHPPTHKCRPAKKRRGSGGSGLGSLLSEPLQAFLGGVQRMPRPQVVKAI